MNIKTYELWKHIGQTIQIKESTDEHVPDGIYLVLTKHEYGLELGNLNTRETTLIEEWGEDDEVILIDHQINLDELLEFKLSNCVQLISEGYTVGNNFLDLTPYLNEYTGLNLLQKAKDI